MPVPLVAGLAVVVPVIVASAEVPVEAPLGMPEFTRAPVVVGYWRYRLSLCHRSTDTGESDTCS